MQISVRSKRITALTDDVFEETEITISDFVRRDDDHRAALAAMHAELTDALDAAEEAARERDNPKLRSVADLLKSPAGQQAMRQTLKAAGQGGQ
jgi:hypothetical protein